ncbi:MAG: hybrid sensor histidine kinase/response regulator, partial [Bacteroidota bacterium]
GIAHDLNNVLGPIMIAVQLLRRKLPLPEDQKMLNMLETVTKRGADMVKHIITFARGVEGKTISIQPQHLLQEIEQMIRETFPKNIDFKMEFARDLWTISGDPTQINQVLLNLSVNARDAMPGGGELTLSVDNAVIDEQSARFHVDAKPGTYVVFTISDSGAGIPQHLLQKIFEPFFTTKEVGKGTGLGLSSSYGIVRSHGGFVSVYSEVGKGTQFKVYIPALPSPAAQRAAEAAPDLPAGNGETILVIDDETSILEITKSTLESFGYRVLTGADGAEGVVLCAKHAGEVRAVICDMNMPLMDGPATIRAVRKILPRVNIIAVSGFMKDEQAIELESGENIRFLPKPYSAEKLLTQLASILRS